MDDAQPDRQESTQGRVQEPHRLNSIVSVWQRPTQAAGPHAFQHDPQASLSAPTISPKKHTLIIQDLEETQSGPLINSPPFQRSISTISSFSFFFSRIGWATTQQTRRIIRSRPLPPSLVSSARPNFFLSNLSLGRTALPSSDTRPSLSFLRIRQMTSPPPEL